MTEIEVVISGVGACFPQSFNVQDFGQALLESRVLTTPTTRWNYDDSLQIPPVCGQVPFEYFDDVFYGINRKLSRKTDPITKLGYRSSYQAMLDAGLHPLALRGQNVAVYAGLGVSEFEQHTMFLQGEACIEGYTIMGMSKSMFANRISNFFDFKGPSVAIDSNWVVGHLEIQQAVEAISSGQCDAALVVASSIVRFIHTSALLSQLGLISHDGFTRCFDEEGSGTVRSDCSVAFLLQRGDVAKRCYAKVLATDATFLGEDFRSNIALPNPRGVDRFLSTLYSTHSINPARIVYLEADGIGDTLRDECELNAIYSALVKGCGRKDPLLVGSVKGNIGLTDAAAGLVGICKAIVAMETGFIPATLNSDSPNLNIQALKDGTLQVASQNTPLTFSEDSVLAVNTLGLSSMVGHTVLQPNPRAQRAEDPSDHLPRLITVSGRTEAGLRDVISKIKAAPFNTGFYRLVQDVFSQNIRGYNFRSYVICPGKQEDDCIVQHVMKRKLWFVYSGMGSQWAGMGAGLMCLPVFAETIERLHAVLQPKGLDLKAIITETGPEAFDNILKCFVGITACQIALTNVLTAVGLVPDGIIGHSLGELGCAYADGCLTEEQTILATWARGVASNEATLIKGMMAAIGLGYKDVLPRLPPTIDVACHNSASSCTLSGPAEDVKRFVKELSDEGVFARAVNVSDIAYHSRYIQPAGPLLRKRLEEVIPEPKRRSDRWVSTSVPQDLWEQDKAKFCSAEYQTNNLLSPVLFEEGLACIPEQSLLVEIAPHGLLQAILKRALPDQVNIPLTQRGLPDSLDFLLNAVGKMSLAGVAPNVAALYPDVQFPVPRGTPSLAQLATWQLDDAPFCDIDSAGEDTQHLGSVDLNLDTPHVAVHGTRLVALSEMLVLLWERAAHRQALRVNTSRLALRNVHVEEWKRVPTEGVEKLRAYVVPSMKRCVVLDCPLGEAVQRILIRSSHVDPAQDEEAPQPLPVVDMAGQEVLTLSKQELYNDLAVRGLRYSTKYQVIESIEMGETDWLIRVRNYSWAGCFEAVIQVFLLRDMEEVQGLLIPRSLQRIDMDPTLIANSTELLLRLHVPSGRLEGPGVFAAGFSAASVPRDLAPPGSAAALQLVPCGETNFKSMLSFLRMAVGLVIPPGKADITLTQLPDGEKTTDLSRALVGAVQAVTGRKARVVTLAPEALLREGPEFGAPLLVTGPDTLAEAAAALAGGAVDAVLAWSPGRPALGGRASTAVPALVVLAEQRVGRDSVALLRRATPPSEANTVVVELGVGAPPPAALAADKEAVLVWRDLGEDAVHAAIQEVDKRPYAVRARLVFILDASAPPFSLATALYAEQLARGARVSVLDSRGAWSGWKLSPQPQPASAALTATSLDGVKLEFLGANPLGCAAGLSGHVDYVGVPEAGGKAGAARVMGVGQWLGDGLRPKLDPLLRWPVPRGWSAADAATVPFVYATMYHALKVKAQARRGESILVHEGASALGQAAIRVAAQLGCAPIYTTVRDDGQRALLADMFPQLEPDNVLTNRDAGSFEHHLMRRTYQRGAWLDRGVSVIVGLLPGGDLQAAVRCLCYQGRLLIHNTEDMLAARSLGMWCFMKGASVYGFSGSELFRSTALERAAVAQAVAEGLYDGTVQPIAGAETFSSASGFSANEGCVKAVFQVQHRPQKTLQANSQHCDGDRSYIVCGREAADALLVAARLALLGARHILAAVESPLDSAAARQRHRTLERQTSARLRVERVRDWSAAELASVIRKAARAGPLSTAILVVKDDGDLAVATLMEEVLSSSPGVGLVLLAERAGVASSLAALAERRNAAGRHTVCLAAPLAEAVDHLVDLLCAPPAVTVLPSAIAVAKAADAHPGDCLPREPAALAALGQAAARVAGLRLRELPSLGSHGRANRENFPLYALPPLGVLDLVSSEQLAGLATRLHSPVVAVEAVPGAAGTLKDTASAVVQAILARQPHGPYNLLGWRLSTVLALEVQRQLEAAGKRGVLFLVHGDVGLVRQWAVQQRVEAPPADPEAQRGAELANALLRALAEHESNVHEAFQWRVNVIRECADDKLSLSEHDQNITVRTSSEVDCASLSHTLNERAAWSHLAGSDDLRLSIQKQ